MSFWPHSCTSVGRDRSPSKRKDTSRMEHRFVSKEMAVASILSKTAAAKAWQRALITLSYTLVGVVVIGFLYWVKALCIPIALALLLTFVLRPVVFWLQEHGF